MFSLIEGNLAMKRNRHCEERIILRKGGEKSLAGSSIIAANKCCR